MFDYIFHIFMIKVDAWFGWKELWFVSIWFRWREFLVAISFLTNLNELLTNATKENSNKRSMCQIQEEIQSGILNFGKTTID